MIRLCRILGDRGGIMEKEEQRNQIVEKYYEEISRYCDSRLKNDFRGAEDCTHDTFLLLMRKQEELDFEQNIRGWLYASADRIMKEYRRKQQRMQSMLLYDLTQIEDPSICSNDLLNSSAFDCLSDDELQFMQEYYSAKKGDHMDLAKQYGMTISELYKKAHAIREKVRNHMK